MNRELRHGSDARSAETISFSDTDPETPMNDTRFPKLQREPVLEEKLPAANPPVRLVKGARIRFAPGSQPGCIGILSRPVAW